MKTVNPKTFYDITKTTRIDPKFIGIAETYAQHKKRRLEIEEQHRNISNSLTYAIKTFTTLQKSLQEKKNQLRRLQGVRQRCNQDHEFKQKFQEQKRRKKEQLRQKSTIERQTLRFNIKSNLKKLKQNRKREKQEMKQQQRLRRQQLSQKKSTQLQRRHMMYSTIKSNHIQGDRKVDEFYRQRNLQSLNNYYGLITSEDMKKQMYEHNISRMNKTLTAVSRKNQRKQRRLLNLNSKISELNPLQTFYSTRLGNYTSQNKQRSYLENDSRISSSMSVKSKKPIRILLDNDQDDLIGPNSKDIKIVSTKNKNFFFSNEKIEEKQAKVTKQIATKKGQTKNASIQKQKHENPQITA